MEELKYPEWFDFNKIKSSSLDWLQAKGKHFKFNRRSSKYIRVQNGPITAIMHISGPVVISLTNYEIPNVYEEQLKRSFFKTDLSEIANVILSKERAVKELEAIKTDIEYKLKKVKNYEEFIADLDNNLNKWIKSIQI